jgi:Tetratricopeptide repeat
VLSLRQHPRHGIAWLEAAAAAARKIGNRRGEGAALGNLGIAYAAVGETRRAIEYYEQQLVTVREIGDRRGEGNALGSLGLKRINKSQAISPCLTRCGSQPLRRAFHSSLPDAGPI